MKSRPSLYAREWMIILMLLSFIAAMALISHYKRSKAVAIYQKR